MEEKRMVYIGVGAVLVIMTTTLLAVTQTAQDDDGGGDVTPEPVLNKTNPLLLISLDGFRSEYLRRGLTTLESLKQNGVWARLIPSYPTLTFPNHYTIVTGMYPEAHGIVSNFFYDPVKNDTFSMGEKDGSWWGGEPIWNTLTLQNKTSATFFWPGSDCDIGGLYPTHYFDYNGDVPYEDRVNQVLEWLSLPEEERPDFVSLYFDEPDHTGHEDGPGTYYNVTLKLLDMDGWISRLLQGLRERKLEDKVNIIVLADHGMESTPVNNILNLNNYFSGIDNTSAYNDYGAFTQLRVDNTSGVTVEDVLANLSCPAGVPMRAYVPKDLPKRFHYSNNRRIGDIVLDLERGYTTSSPNSSYEHPYLGNHGYDNYLYSMSALFIASGPDFKKGVSLLPFQNIELYNLMCLLLDVDPAPNNGTLGALYDALLEPPFVPDVPYETKPPAALFDPTAKNNDSVIMAHCPGDISLPGGDWWEQELGFDKSAAEKLEESHCPWGVPLSGNKSDMLLLHHKDHVTGYSEDLKMPLWTSFTLTQGEGSPVNRTLWNSDVRLNASNTPSCDSYKNISVPGKTVMMAPLFHPVFSVNATLAEIPYLVSNAVPLVSESAAMDTVVLLADTWKWKIAPLNLVIGLAFDYNADSLPDDIPNNTSLAVPSHIFLVVTRCIQLVSSFDECTNPEDLDTQAFIFSQFHTAENTCLTELEYANFHKAPVRDVELLTGLTFFHGLEPEDRLQLTLRIPTSIL